MLARVGKDLANLPTSIGGHPARRSPLRTAAPTFRRFRGAFRATLRRHVGFKIQPPLEQGWSSGGRSQPIISCDSLAAERAHHSQGNGSYSAKAPPSMKISVRQRPPLYLPLMRLARGRRIFVLGKGDAAFSAPGGHRRLTPTASQSAVRIFAGLAGAAVFLVFPWQQPLPAAD